VAGPWTVLPTLAREVPDALRSIEGTLVASVHQSHAYADGACLYFTFAGRAGDGPSGPADADPRDLSPAESYYRAAWDAVSETVVRHGAAISHHHGIGVNRGRFLPDALGTGLGVLEKIKAALDPHGILNPGTLGLPSPFGEVSWP
jgi:alkyldihydroxyacetonephosphate synthase